MEPRSPFDRFPSSSSTLKQQTSIEMNFILFHFSSGVCVNSVIIIFVDRSNSDKERKEGRKRNESRLDSTWTISSVRHFILDLRKKIQPAKLLLSARNLFEQAGSYLPYSRFPHPPSMKSYHTQGSRVLLSFVHAVTRISRQPGLPKRT